MLSLSVWPSKAISEIERRRVPGTNGLQDTYNEIGLSVSLHWTSDHRAGIKIRGNRACRQYSLHFYRGIPLRFESLEARQNAVVTSATLRENWPLDSIVQRHKPRSTARRAISLDKKKWKSRVPVYLAMQGIAKPCTKKCGDGTKDNLTIPTSVA